MKIITDVGKIMPMKHPPHPGKVVFDECIRPLGLTITEAAEGLGVNGGTVQSLNKRYKYS